MREYLKGAGKAPFREWLKCLPIEVQVRIQARILRLELGNFGDHKWIENGVWELRFHFGPGYRVYFGKLGRQIYLLTGGDKKTQGSDIRKAQDYWKTFQEFKNVKKKS